MLLVVKNTTEQKVCFSGGIHGVALLATGVTGLNAEATIRTPFQNKDVNQVDSHTPESWLLPLVVVVNDPVWDHFEGFHCDC